MCGVVCVNTHKTCFQTWYCRPLIEMNHFHVEPDKKLGALFGFLSFAISEQLRVLGHGFSLIVAGRKQLLAGLASVSQ